MKQNIEEFFSYRNGTSLSEAIILSCLSSNPNNDFLKVSDYRNNEFVEIWRKQFSQNISSFKPQFRTELNQGEGRLAYRVFESPYDIGESESKGHLYRLKDYSTIDTEDLKIINNLKKLLNKIYKNEYSEQQDDEVEYQNSDWVEPKRTIGKVNKTERSYSNNSRGYRPRNRSIRNASLFDSNYMCEINSNHITFINKSTGKNYVEAHHLIPMEYYDEFDYSIDVEPNIIALCPNCHEEIHKSNYENQKKMIQILFTDKRKKDLSTRGINISVDEISEYYK